MTHLFFYRIGRSGETVSGHINAEDAAHAKQQLHTLYNFQDDEIVELKISEDKVGSADEQTE